jgi:hypothetical protein
MFFVASDDEVGGFQSAIRSERSEQLNTVSRARRTEEKRADNAFRLGASTKSAGARCASRKAK